MPGPLVLLRMGPTLPHLAAGYGEFEGWIRPHLGLSDSRLLTVCPYLDSPLPEPETVAGAILTGAGAMVTDALPWLSTTAAWLRRMAKAERPLLGICFGHQLLAQTFGGQVDFNPHGPQVGTVRVQPTSAAAADPLLTWTAPVWQQTSHLQSVLRLPPEAALLAQTPQDPYHAFRLGERIWGVQFHPEFSDITMRAYIAHHRPRLEAAGQNAAQLEAAVRDCPEGRRLLARFGALIRREVGHG